MLRQDRGVTLVELLIAVAITGVLSIAIVRTISTAETTISRSAEQTVSSVQTMRFIGLLKYDIGGASDVFVFDGNVPSGTARLCTTWTSGDGNAWSDPTNPRFVRELFSMQIPTLTPPSQPGPLPTYLTARSQLVGYELRRQSGSAVKYDIFRVVCDGGQQSQRVLSLGADLQPGAAGTTSLRCYGSSGSDITVSVGQSTMSSSVPAAQRCASFGFVVPYTGGATAIQRLLSMSSLQRMSSAVTTA